MTDAPAAAREVHLNPEQGALPSALVIRKWDILFSFTTYLEQPLDETDFYRIAGKTVSSGLAEVAYSSAGFLFWYTDSLQVKKFDLDLEPYTRQKQATIQFPTGLAPYQTQCALHAAQQRFHEQQTLSPMAQEGYAYFRAYLSPCELIISGRTSTLYPVITVHRNGVVQISFRALNAQNDTPVEVLIDKIMNLISTGTEDIFMPPALLGLDVEQILSSRSNSRKERSKAKRELASLGEKIRQHQEYRQYSEDGFEHLQVSVKALSINSGPQPSLAMVASMTINAIELLANKRSNRSKSRGRAMHRQGEFGMWRHHVYIRTTVPHPETATEMAELYAEPFGKILFKSSSISSEFARKELGQQLRLAEDYLSYVGRAASLSVYSAQGIRQHKGFDPHDNELVYQLHAKADFADFMAGSYWQCEEVALRPL
ncbi:hypothetical protein [Deinococcus irradiatisoli]|uniref:hypothetical protein n=1 Tax=Deinococcus irradiatisoli TaxID=2202254 RepID=UPI0011B26B9F|nr:hypothetical protein [Deinococcus irradiatisoli]